MEIIMIIALILIAVVFLLQLWLIKQPPFDPKAPFGIFSLFSLPLYAAN